MNLSTGHALSTELLVPTRDHDLSHFLLVPTMCSGGHGFDSYQGLRIFFVPRSCHVDQFTFAIPVQQNLNKLSLAGKTPL